jgi:hypothetical protein
MSVSSKLGPWFIPARHSTGVEKEREKERESVYVCVSLYSCSYALGQEAVTMTVDIGKALSEAECQLRPS